MVLRNLDVDTWFTDRYGSSDCFGKGISDSRTNYMKSISLCELAVFQAKVNTIFEYINIQIFKKTRNKKTYMCSVNRGTIEAFAKIITEFSVV